MPPQPSVLSAFGTLVTSVRLDLVRSDLVRIGDLDWARVDRILGELAREATAASTEAGCSRRQHHADLRRRPALFRPAERTDRRPRRRSAHPPRRAPHRGRVRSRPTSKLYGVNPSHVPIELVTWRVTARGPIIPFNRAMHAAGDARPAEGRRGRCMPGATGVACRSTIASTLAAGQTIAGPGDHRGARDHHGDSAGLDGDGRQDRLYHCAEGMRRWTASSSKSCGPT